MITFTHTYLISTRIRARVVGCLINAYKPNRAGCSEELGLRSEPHVAPGSVPARGFCFWREMAGGAAPPSMPRASACQLMPVVMCRGYLRRFRHRVTCHHSTISHYSSPTSLLIFVMGAIFETAESGKARCVLV